MLLCCAPFDLRFAETKIECVTFSSHVIRFCCSFLSVKINRIVCMHRDVTCSAELFLRLKFHFEIEINIARCMQIQYMLPDGWCTKYTLQNECKWNDKQFATRSIPARRWSRTFIAIFYKYTNTSHFKCEPKTLKVSWMAHATICHCNGWYGMARHGGYGMPCLLLALMQCAAAAANELHFVTDMKIWITFTKWKW